MRDFLYDDVNKFLKESDLLETMLSAFLIKDPSPGTRLSDKFSSGSAGKAIVSHAR